MKILGYLRSVDQFANLVLHQTIERIHVGKCYGDIPRGVFVVRGENVVLLGEIDVEKTEPKDIGLTEVSLEEILEKQVITENINISPFISYSNFPGSSTSREGGGGQDQDEGVQGARAHLHRTRGLRGYVLAPPPMCLITNLWREKITDLQVTSEVAKLKDLTMKMMKTRSLMSAPLNRQILVPLNREELIQTEQ